jgi:hypothetical protein
MMGIIPSMPGEFNAYTYRKFMLNCHGCISKSYIFFGGEEKK